MEAEEFAEGIVKEFFKKIDIRKIIEYPNVLLEFGLDGISITHCDGCNPGSQTELIEIGFEKDGDNKAFARMLNSLIHLKGMYNKHSDVNVNVGITPEEKDVLEVISEGDYDKLLNAGFTVTRDL